jgi:hypothetical protein
VPVIQDKEVADVFWVDVQELFNPVRYQPFVWPMDDLVPMMRHYPLLKTAVQKVLGDMRFGSIYLPRPNHPPPDDDPAPRERFDFILWGLTMRMVSDLFTIGNIPLPMDIDVQPHFQSRRLGDVVVFTLRYPQAALKRAMGVAAACTALGFVASRL